MLAPQLAERKGRRCVGRLHCSRRQAPAVCDSVPNTLMICEVKLHTVHVDVEMYTVPDNSLAFPARCRPLHLARLHHLIVRQASAFGEGETRASAERAPRLWDEGDS